MYEKPKKLWEAERLEEERHLLKEYGLKNMRELWRMQTLLRKTRREARRLLAARGAGIEERTKRLLERASRFLIKKAAVTLDDILSLSTRDILERRLETIVLRKGMASTVAMSRQLIAHGHIAVNGVRSDSPSRLITFSEEPLVTWYSKPIRSGETKAEPSGSITAVEAVKAEAPAAAGAE